MLIYVIPLPPPEVMRTLHVKGALELPGALQLTRILLLRLLLSRALVVNVPRRRRRNKSVLVAGIRQAGVIMVRRRGMELVVVSAWIVHIVDAQELMMMTGVILIGGAGTGTRRRNDGRRNG